MPRRKTKIELACIRRVRKSALFGSDRAYRTIDVATCVRPATALTPRVHVVTVLYEVLWLGATGPWMEVRSAMVIKLPEHEPYIAMDAIVHNENRGRA